MSKKWIALALVIAMMLSLAACGGSQTPKETTEPTQASEAAQTEQTPTEAQETATPTATTTKETLTIALPVEPATLGSLCAFQPERLYLHQPGTGTPDQEER